MSTFIDGIGASQNIDSSGECILIEGMDISSLDRSGVFNWEHLKDHPGQIVGKILKAKKIFSEKDCEDDRQLMYWKKCGVPYIYVMGELMDDYKDSAKEVAGMFRYDHDRQDRQEVDVLGFSIEGSYIAREGSMVVKSIARKCTITTANCNKMALAKMVPSQDKQKDDIDSLFKTELNEHIDKIQDDSPLIKSFFPKKAPNWAAASFPKVNYGTSIGQVGKLNVGSHARPTHFATASHQELKGIADLHFNAGRAAQASGNRKVGQHHLDQQKRFMDASSAAEQKSKAMASTRAAVAPKMGIPANSVAKPDKLFDRQLTGKMAPPSPIRKALDAGSAMAAPSQLVGGAALVSESLEGKKKKKNKWLQIAEQAYATWEKREIFEQFLAKRMPNLTKGEIIAIGQVLALNKTITMEKALSQLTQVGDDSIQLPSLEKAAGKDSIYTLILFEGCELPDILHCSHFATDDISDGTLEKISEACEKYFKSEPESKELSFLKEGSLGKQEQPVLFLTEGDPYKGLFDELAKIAKYKYDEFKPHVSVTSNVDEFKGKASSLVISVNGEIKKKFDFKK